MLSTGNHVALRESLIEYERPAHSALNIINLMRQISNSMWQACDIFP